MNLREWLGGLAPRERKLVVAAAALIAVALVYEAILMPLAHAHARQVERVRQKTSDLAWMHQEAPQVAAIAARRGVGGKESLVVLVDRTTRRLGLGGAIREQSPDGENGLRLRLEGASFDAMMTWLSMLQQQAGVSVSDATIDAGSAPGLVNASITLTHGAAATR